MMLFLVSISFLPSKETQLQSQFDSVEASSFSVHVVYVFACFPFALDRGKSRAEMINDRLALPLYVVVAVVAVVDLHRTWKCQHSVAQLSMAVKENKVKLKAKTLPGNEI